MSKYTQMPPTAGQPWNFESWDNAVRDTPPWIYRNFWYHSNPGGSDRLVIVWGYAFDEGGYEVLVGDIYQCRDMLQAILLQNRFRQDIESGDRNDRQGSLIFFGNRGICESSIIGKPFPAPLPDGRWR